MLRGGRILLTVLGLCSPSFAAFQLAPSPKSRRCEDPVSIPSTLLRREARDGVRTANRAELALMRNLISENLELLTSFQPPMAFDFLIERGAGKPRFAPDKGLGRIFVPEWILSTTDSRNRLGRAILSHELAHLIFVINLGVLSKGPFSRAWQQAWEEHLQIQRSWGFELERLHSETKAAYAATEDAYRRKSREAARLGQRHRNLVREYRALEKQYNDATAPFYDLSEESMGYQELFSDLMEALYSDSLTITAESVPLFIHNLEQKKNLKRLQLFRDFTNQLTPRDMKKLKASENDPHHDLAAVRGFIGRTFLHEKMSLDEKDALLKKVFDAIALELNERFNTKTKRLRKLSLDKVNQRLIDRLGEAGIERRSN